MICSKYTSYSLHLKIIIAIFASNTVLIRCTIIFDECNHKKIQDAGRKKSPNHNHYGLIS